MEKVEKLAKERLEGKLAERRKFVYKARADGDVKEFNTLRAVCGRYGLLHGERVVFRSGRHEGKEATVIGVREGWLWRHIDGDPGATAFFAHNAAELTARYHPEQLAPLLSMEDVKHLTEAEKTLLRERIDACLAPPAPPPPITPKASSPKAKVTLKRKSTLLLTVNDVMQKRRESLLPKVLTVEPPPLERLWLGLRTDSVSVLTCRPFVEGVFAELGVLWEGCFEEIARAKSIAHRSGAKLERRDIMDELADCVVAPPEGQNPLSLVIELLVAVSDARTTTANTPPKLHDVTKLLAFLLTATPQEVDALLLHPKPVPVEVPVATPMADARTPSKKKRRRVQGFVKASSEDFEPIVVVPPPPPGAANGHFVEVFERIGVALMGVEANVLKAAEAKARSQTKAKGAEQSAEKEGGKGVQPALQYGAVLSTVAAFSGETASVVKSAYRLLTFMTLDATVLLNTNPSEDLVCQLNAPDDVCHTFACARVGDWLCLPTPLAASYSPYPLDTRANLILVLKGKVQGIPIAKAVSNKRDYGIDAFIGALSCWCVAGISDGSDPFDVSSGSPLFDSCGEAHRVFVKLVWRPRPAEMVSMEKVSAAVDTIVRRFVALRPKYHFSTVLTDACKKLHVSVKRDPTRSMVVEKSGDHNDSQLLSCLGASLLGRAVDISPTVLAGSGLQYYLPGSGVSSHSTAQQTSAAPSASSPDNVSCTCTPKRRALSPQFSASGAASCGTTRTRPTHDRSLRAALTPSRTPTALFP